MVIQADGPPCQGNCPNHGCVEALASGTALGREGMAAAESAPGLGARQAAGGGGEGRRHRRDRGGAGRRRDRDRRLRPDRRPARGRLHQLRQHLPARRDRRRRRRHRGRRPAARPGPARSPRTGADADEPDPDPGGDPRQRRRDDRRRGAGPGRTRAGERADAGPAGRLPDPDRQPRRRHPAGPRGAGQRRLHRLRGHPPHRLPARQAGDPPGAAAGLQPRGQRSRAGRPSWRSGSSAATPSPWSPTPACRRSPTPATS